MTSAGSNMLMRIQNFGHMHTYKYLLPISNQNSNYFSTHTKKAASLLESHFNVEMPTCKKFSSKDLEHIQTRFPDVSWPI